MTETNLIRWVDNLPAPHVVHGGRRKTFIEELKARPGEWAMYRPGHGHPTSVGSQFRADFGDRIEATIRSRQTKPATYDCYVRWVGE